MVTASWRRNERIRHCPARTRGSWFDLHAQGVTLIPRLRPCTNCISPGAGMGQEASFGKRTKWCAQRAALAVDSTWVLGGYSVITAVS